MLNLDRGQDFLVGYLELVADPKTEIVGAAEPDSAPALGRILHGADEQFGVLSRVDERTHHAASAGIEVALHQGVVHSVEPHDRGAFGVAGGDRLEEGLGLRDIHGGVFGIDADKVEAAGRHQFGDDGRAGIAPSADRCAAGAESGAEVAHGMD